MKKLLGFILALVLSIGCTAQQYNVTASPTGAIKTLPNGASVLIPAGGSANQIQYNASGSLGGFTASGDATVVPSTGVVTIAANAVTNAKAAQMATMTIKGNNTGGTANAADLTATQAKAVLAIAAGDISGLGSMALQNSTAVSISGGAVNGVTENSLVRVGIGAIASTSADLLINHSVPPSSGQASVVISGTVTAPPATDLHPDGFRDNGTYTSAVDADGYASYDALAGIGGTHDYNHFIAYQIRNAFNGSGTLGRLEGVSAFLGANGGHVTEERAFYVSNMTIAGGSVVAHQVGLFIDQLSGATVNDNFYFNNTNRAFMAGGQFITSALLTTPAGDATMRMQATFDQASQTGIGVMNSNATATGKMVSFFNSGGTLQGSIAQTNSTTIAYNTSSDARLKENVRDFADSGLIIDAMKPRVFDWKAGYKNDHGFIAQELYGVYPEAVTKGDDGATITSAWQIDYSKLTPVLTAEVKDLRRRVLFLEHCQTVGFILIGGLIFNLFWSNLRRKAA